MTSAEVPATRTSTDGEVADAFRRDAGGLWGFFVKRDVPAADAADLVSETFLAAWKSSKTSTIPPELLRAWLFGIARKTLSRYRRGRRRRSALGDRLRATLAIDVDAQRYAFGGGDERVDRVRALIQSLRSIDQEIVRLVYWDGFSQEEVAAILDKPATVVRSRLSRARKVLREQLVQSGDVE